MAVAKPWPYTANKARKQAIEMADDAAEVLEDAHRNISRNPQQAAEQIRYAQYCLANISRTLIAAGEEKE